VVEWLLLSDEEAVHQKEPGAILDFIPYEESTYSTDPAIRRLEAEVRRSEVRGDGLSSLSFPLSNFIKCDRSFSSFYYLVF